MTQERPSITKKDRFILLRIVVGFFFLGMVKNLVDIMIDEYHNEWILWIKYLGLILACTLLFLLYRWGYFLFLSVVLFTGISFAVVDPETRSTLFLGLIGPIILSAVVIPKWKRLRAWPSPKTANKPAMDKPDPDSSRHPDSS